jgi:hypothetical protein
VRLHEEELTFSDLSPEEKELYAIEDPEESDDLAADEDNAIAHHPE